MQIQRFSSFLPYLLLGFFSIFIQSNSFAQIEISGKVTDAEDQSPLGSSSVVFSPVGQSNILGYGISDRDGNFKVRLNTSLDSITVKVSSLGYTDFEKTIAAKSQTLQINLESAAESLEAIFLRRPPITKRGDTLIFDPQAFKSTKDRSIKDVLGKMPGIEIDASGEIKYQGRPINKFYVEGLDLTDGKYGLIANNLSADKVSSVEVLENHQPLKVLEDMEASEDAAINIKLKNKVTVSGNIEAGAGASPGLWFGKLTPMFFTKKFQTMVTYQTNNIGVDITSDFSSFSRGAFRFGFSSSGKTNWLNTAGVSTPPFSEKRWLDNQGHAISANTLFKNKKDYEFKIDVSYINNLTRQKGGNLTTYMLPEGDVIIDNMTSRDKRDESMEVAFSIEQNKDKNYLKEKISFSKQWDRASAFLTENGDPQRHQLQTPFTDFKNDFEIIFPIGKQLLTLDSNIGYNESPQELRITPGVFTDILNPDEEVEWIEQDVQHKVFYANHSVDFTKRLGDFSISFRPGIDFKTQDMDSQLYLENQKHPNTDFENQMKWQELTSYIRTRISYRTDKTRLMFSIPFDLTQYKIEDKLNQDTQTKTPFTINPFFWGEYEFVEYWKVNGNANYNRRYGPLTQMYSGFLLSNYRNLARYDVPLMESTSSNASVGLQYRNPINSWFGRINYSHTEGKNDQIFNTITQPDGSTLVEAINQTNKTASNSVSGSISRLIDPIKTTFKLNSSFSHSNRDMLLNSELMKNTTDSWNHGFGLNGDFVDWMTLEYDGSLTMTTTKNSIQNSRKVTSQNHKVGLYFYFLKNHTLNLSGEWMKSDLEGNSWDEYFGDIMYRFTLSEKRKIDFEFSVINLFDSDVYRNLSVGDYTISETYYRLRPRQFFVKVRFPL